MLSLTPTLEQNRSHAFLHDAGDRSVWSLCRMEEVHGDMDSPGVPAMEDPRKTRVRPNWLSICY